MSERLANTAAAEREQNVTLTLEALMREYGNTVLRTAVLYVKDIHTAEDIFQEVFLKVNEKLASFRNESSIKTWLVRITINTCKDYLKSAYHKRVVTLEQFQEDALTAEDAYDEVERRVANGPVTSTVAELPEKYRSVLICVYYQELSIAETAAILGLPEGTVKSRLARAKQRLRELLEGRVEYAP